MSRVLLVEDDDSLGTTLCERLAREGHDVTWVTTAAGGVDQVERGGWALAVFDVRLPDGSGFDLARLAKTTTETPVMLMTALDSATNRLEGFETGADEFLPKPFHLREFLLRVRHVLATQPAPTPAAVVRIRGLAIDLGALSITDRAGDRTFIAPRDGAVLRLLIEAAPAALDRFAVLERVWTDRTQPSTRVVDNAIVRLRQALRDENGELIESVRGVGYRWNAGNVEGAP